MRRGLIDWMIDAAPGSRLDWKEDSHYSNSYTKQSNGKWTRVGSDFEYTEDHFGEYEDELFNRVEG